MPRTSKRELARRKAARERAISEGKCGRCLKKPVKPGRRTCDDCLDHQRGRRLEYQKRRSAEALAKGLCVRCKKVKPNPGKKTCDRCLSRLSEQDRKRKGLSPKTHRPHRSNQEPLLPEDKNSVFVRDTEISMCTYPGCVSYGPGGRCHKHPLSSDILS